jgi:hypothetical protein
MERFLLRVPVCFLFLLFASTSSAQVDSMMGVYADKLPLEKMHIHFDKSVYNKAETVWYKVYILQSAEAALNSKNVYLEWYDAEGKMISQSVAPLYQSTATGSFDIPVNYKGESVTVKAYTRWMLNDDPAFNYEKQIPVNTGSLKTSARPPAAKTKVEIFPEGGFLVQGLTTRIAFKATNQYGHPVFIKGAITDNTNTVLDSINVKHDGMGSFYLSPLPQQAYQLNWTDENGIPGSTPLPVTKNEGARIDIKASAGKVRFQVDRTATAPDNFKHMILLVHMNQVALFQVDINASEKTMLTGDIPVTNIPSGLLQFTLFTSDWIPVAERVVFVNKRTHQFEASVSAPVINLDKRGKNVVEIYVADTAFANMSLAITDASLNMPDQQTIFSDILLNSEIKGKINNPSYYFSSDADSVKEHLDLIMLTNGWRRFDWEKIKGRIAPKVAYTAETDYMTLRGKVSGLNRNNSDVIMNLIVAAKDSSRKLLLVPVEKNGNFEQPLFFYDTARIYYSFNNNKKLTESAPQVLFENGLMKAVPNKKIPVGNTYPFTWTDSTAKSKLDIFLSEQELLRKKMAETTLQEVTVTTTVKTPVQVLNEKYSSGFFGKNEAGIFDLTDGKVTVAQNVFEYLQGKIAGLEINGSRANWRGDEPSYFLNEMLVPPDSKQTLLDIPMINIAMVKVYRPPFMFATGGGRGGAIAVWTKKGADAAKQNEPKGLDNTVLSGYTQFKEFYNPTYETPTDAASLSADKRITLYWNPNIVTDAKNQKVRIEFFNNDFTKTFQLVLEGVNEAGKMTRVVRTIDAGAKME